MSFKKCRMSNGLINRWTFKQPIEELHFMLSCQLQSLLNTHEPSVYTNVWSPAALANIPRSPIAHFNATHVTHFCLRLQPTKENDTQYFRAQYFRDVINRIVLRKEISRLIIFMYWRAKKRIFIFVLCHK